jgi:hypothetical protein
MVTPLPDYAMLQVALSRSRLGAGAISTSRKPESNFGCTCGKLGANEMSDLVLEK